MDERNLLFETLEAAVEAANDHEVTLGALNQAMHERGFGPILMLLSAIVMLPTGIIPGVPALVGLVILAFAAQLLVGFDQPWIPNRLRRMSIDGARLRASIHKARPYVEKLSRVVRPRLSFLASGPIALRVMSLALACASAVMIVIGFIPFLPFVLGLVTLCFGIALTVRDGIFALVGYGTFAPALWLILRQFT